MPNFGGKSSPSEDRESVAEFPQAREIAVALIFSPTICEVTGRRRTGVHYGPIPRVYTRVNLSDTLAKLPPTVPPDPDLIRSAGVHRHH